MRIGVSRLRASGTITVEMTRTRIGLADVEAGLSLQKFPNGGSWSLFRCPSCGRKARTLRLKPHLWGTMERRSRLEAALRRAEFVVSRHAFADLSDEDETKMGSSDALHSEGSCQLCSLDLAVVERTLTKHYGDIRAAARGNSACPCRIFGV
jgi:hypothetical protein